MLLVLAVEWVELVVVSIGIVIYVGNQIAKAIRGEQGGKPSADSAGSEAARKARLEQLAAHRREQLRQLAKQRGGATPDAAPPTEPPSQGQGQQTIYQRRAEALRRARQQQTGQTTDQPTSADARLAQARAEAAARRRQQEEHQARAQAQAQAEARAQQQRIVQDLERSKASLAERDRIDALRREDEQRQRAERMGTAQRARQDSTTGAGSTKRPVADADSPVYALHGEGKSQYRKLLRGKSLRTAVILSEVLGQPKALRNPDTNAI